MLDDRLKVAEKSLNEAKEYISKDDAIQSSEKIYKVVEECIKLLAGRNESAEYKRAKKEGRWWTHSLGRAASNLAYKLNEKGIEDSWANAYDLHVWGFHERKYDVEIVRHKLHYAEWILNYTKNSSQ